MIRWVFWDIGDTLLNEDPLRCRIWERLHDELLGAGSGLAFTELMALRERLASQDDPSPHYTVARDRLPPDVFARWEQWARTFPRSDGQQLTEPIVGALDALTAVKQYARLGIIADQPSAVLDTLERLGMRSPFEVIVLSESVGVNKPDPEMFRIAAGRAKCDPAECVMVGNRLDTDCAPARRVGMRCVFCYLPADAKGWRPSTDRERVYVESLTRIPNWRSLPRDSDEAPDATVNSLAEIGAIMSRWSE